MLNQILVSTVFPTSCILVTVEALQLILDHHRTQKIIKAELVSWRMHRKTDKMHVRVLDSCYSTATFNMRYPDKFTTNTLLKLGKTQQLLSVLYPHP